MPRQLTYTRGVPARRPSQPLVVRVLRSPLVWGPASVALFGLTVAQSGVLAGGRWIVTLDAAPLLTAVALNVGVVTFWSIRSAVLLRALGAHVSSGGQAPMVLAAFAVNNATPASTGEALRIYLLHRRNGVGYARATASILIERVVALFYLIASSIVVWLVAADRLHAGIAVAGLALATALPAVVLRVVRRPTTSALRLPGLRSLAGDQWDSVRDAADALDTNLGAALDRPLVSTIFAVSTYLVFALFTAQLMLVARAADAHLEPLEAWASLGLAFGAGIVSLVPFGLGTTDIALVGLLLTFGIAAPEAATIAVGFRLVSTVPLALCGAASYAYLSATHGPPPDRQPAERA